MKLLFSYLLIVSMFIQSSAMAAMTPETNLDTNETVRNKV